MRKVLIFLIFIVCANAESVYATFEAEGIKHAKLSLQTQGVVTATFAEVGKRVKKGDLLLTLESSEQKAQLDLAQSDLELAKNRFDRAFAIKDTISKDELEAHEAGYKRTKALAEYHKAVVANRELKAPFDGVVAGKFVQVGELIERASNGAYLIVDDSTTKLVLSFDQRYLDLIKKGQNYRFKINGVEFNAEIDQIYPTVATATRKANAVVYTKGVPHGVFGDGFIEVK